MSAFPATVVRDPSPMRTRRTAQDELRLIEGLLADAALDKALLRLRRGSRHQKDWATQPRAPAGQSDGGQWIADAGGRHDLPPTAWASLRNGEPDGGDKPSTTTESTTLEDGTRVLSLRIHAGRRAFDEQHAVIAPDGESRIFETSGATQTIRDGDTGEVLSRTTFTPTDLVSEPVIQPAFSRNIPSIASRIFRTPNATVLGSHIHAEVARTVNEQRDPDFVAELIFSDVNEFGKRIISGSVRADIFERVHPDTACIYDPKTGKKGLTPARAIELSAAAQRAFGSIKRFIIIQVRPAQ